MIKERLFLLLLMAVTMVGLASCSKDDDVAVEEFPNWQATNSAYWQQLISDTRAKIAAGDDTWKILPTWTLEEEQVTIPDDRKIVVRIVHEGKGTESPIFTDTVKVNYSGRLLPSTTHKSGLLFENTWSADYNPDTSAPRKLAVAAVVEGWATALQQMHVGDRWQVYIPYPIGYGTTPPSGSSIPAYSTLIFDMELESFWHAKSKGK